MYVYVKIGKQKQTYVMALKMRAAKDHTCTSVEPATHAPSSPSLLSIGPEKKMKLNYLRGYARGQGIMHMHCRVRRTNVKD